ncbi:MAG: lytic transglycosylase domain-containing protein [Sandaracinaceae bacterium]|nr:lytic transglycosylase domain-containing protein [Sandaracinaceae bacterium]
MLRRALPRTLRMALGTTLAATVLGALVASPLLAQTHEPDPTVSALVRALERRMTVWRSPTGETVQYVGHCRAARGGCARRVTTFANLIGEASGRHQLDPFLLAAVAVRESGLNPLAAGAAGERGIVQLHPRGSGSRARFVRSEAYRQRCSRTEGACQAEILDIGARLLARSIERCGSVRDGLGAYNRGECGATSYTDRVMRERSILLRLAKRNSQDP